METQFYFPEWTDRPQPQTTPEARRVFAAALIAASQPQQSEVIPGQKPGGEA